MLEQMSTAVAAKPMPMAAETEVEMARVGQVPSTSTSTGFSLMRPRIKMDSLECFILSTLLYQ